ncbi:hypothetical protein AAF712_011371 [Marasmius tenuissimus]|uniref:Uncharacterized protein n=1 Tax=Marasmius tenuissimus TaxID=585030 RepID=A0ABR2ZKB3_9AGAR
MKLAALGFLTFVPLITQAAEVTFVVFRPQNSEFPDSADDHDTRTVTEAFLVPIGTNGAETTYLYNNLENLATITTTVNGVSTTSWSSVFSSNTIVASASGFKGTKMQGFDAIDCRYTDDKAGECFYRYDDVENGQTTLVTSTAIGIPHGIVVSVSERSGGASPTDSENVGSGSGDGNGNNGATSIAAGKMIAGVLGGLVIGAYAVLLL